MLGELAMGKHNLFDEAIASRIMPVLDTFESNHVADIESCEQWLCTLDPSAVGDALRISVFATSSLAADFAHFIETVKRITATSKDDDEAHPSVRRLCRLLKAT